MDNEPSGCATDNYNNQAQSKQILRLLIQILFTERLLLSWPCTLLVQALYLRKYFMEIIMQFNLRSKLLNQEYLQRAD